MIGGQLLQEASCDAYSAPQVAARARSDSGAAQQCSVESQPSRLNKKHFPERTEVSRGRALTQPGVDGGELTASVMIGEPKLNTLAQVPQSEELRAQQVELTKKLEQRHAPWAEEVSEWQFRTREIVTTRSKERANVRWR